MDPLDENELFLTEATSSVPESRVSKNSLKTTKLRVCFANFESHFRKQTKNSWHDGGESGARLKKARRKNVFLVDAAGARARALWLQGVALTSSIMSSKTILFHSIDDWSCVTQGQSAHDKCYEIGTELRSNRQMGASRSINQTIWRIAQRREVTRHDDYGENGFGQLTWPSF